MGVSDGHKKRATASSGSAVERKLPPRKQARPQEEELCPRGVPAVFSVVDGDAVVAPCRPYWENTADEARFLRFMGLAYDCDKARAV